MRSRARRQEASGSLCGRAEQACRQTWYRLRHALRQARRAPLWSDRQSLRCLLVLALLVTIGAGGMFWRDVRRAESGDVSFSVPGPEPAETPSAVPSAPDPQPAFADTVPGYTVRPGAARRGPLSAHTSLDPMEGMSDGLRKNAAYNERADATLADAARQVDAALMQAWTRLHLSSSAMRVADSETRVTREGRVYPFLRLELALPPVTQSRWIETLREALAVWAPRARLHREGPELLFVTIDGEVTHSLICGPRDPLPQPLPSTDPTPRLTIIMDDVGENLQAVRRLLALPYPVTLSIWPESTHAAYAATLAREHGRQVFVHQPMEPLPGHAGPAGMGVLTVGMDQDALAAHMSRSLRLVPYAEGVNNHMGSRFTADVSSMRCLCAALKAIRPDILVVDSLTHRASVLYDEAHKQGLAAFRRSLFLDDVRGEAAIGRELEHALTLARRGGHIVVIGHPRPDTLAALEAWQGYRQDAVALVPLARPGNTNGGMSAQQEQP